MFDALIYVRKYNGQINDWLFESVGNMTLAAAVSCEISNFDPMRLFCHKSNSYQEDVDAYTLALWTRLANISRPFFVFP